MRLNVIHYYQLKQPFLPTHVEWLNLPSHDYFKWFTTDSSYDQYAKNWFTITTKNGYYNNLSVWFEKYLSFYFGFNNQKFKVILTKK